MGSRFEEYVRAFESTADERQRAELDAFRAHHHLAAQFREHRKHLGLTQHQLAVRIGVDQAEISRLERGEGNPTEHTLLRAAHALGLTLTLVPTGTASVPDGGTPSERV